MDSQKFGWNLNVRGTKMMKIELMDAQREAQKRRGPLNGHGIGAARLDKL